MTRPRREECCSFCGAPSAARRLLFRSALGGFPPAICDVCVLDLAGAIEDANAEAKEETCPHTAS